MTGSFQKRVRHVPAKSTHMPVLDTPRRIAERTVARFKRSQSGIAAVEFALIVPIMFLMFVGTFELSQGITVDRRVTQVASSTADLIARTTSTTTAEVDGIMQIIDEVLAPYDASLMTLSVGNVTAAVDDENETKVCWAYQHNGGTGGQLETGADYQLPQGIIGPGESVIVTEVQYNYSSSLFNIVIENAITLEETFYQKPRLSAYVEYNGQPC